MKSTVVIEPTKCERCKQIKEPGTRMETDYFEGLYWCENCDEQDEL